MNNIADLIRDDPDHAFDKNGKLVDCSHSRGGARAVIQNSIYGEGKVWLGIEVSGERVGHHFTPDEARAVALALMQQIAADS